MNYLDWAIYVLSVANTVFFIGGIKTRRAIKRNWKAADERAFKLRMAAQLSRRP